MAAGPPPRVRRPRGCVILASVAAVLVRLTAVLAVMGLSTPDLGALPAGVDDGPTQQAFDLQDLLASTSVLRLARSSLDCVGIGDDGVRLGFHRIGVAAAPGACA